MAKSGGYSIENLYEPGYASFNPSESVPHYLGKQNLIPASKLGLTTDPRTANQISELSNKLNTGTQMIEVGSMDMGAFDTIPKQHWEEMRRKAKLAEAKLSLHAPIQDMDPSGFSQQGWDASKRELVEKQLKEVIDKAAILDKKGNLPVTIHGSGTAGSTFRIIGNKKDYEQLVGVDKSTGQLVPIKESIQFQPGGDLNKGEKINPLNSLEMHNFTSWRKEVDQILFEKETADKIISDVYPVAKDIYLKLKFSPPEERNKLFNQLPPQQKELILNLQTADAHIHQANLNVINLFDKAYQYGGKDEKERKEIREKLKKLAEEYDRNIHGGYTSEEYKKIIEKAQKEKKFSEEEKYNKILESQLDLKNQSHAIQNFAEKLRQYNPEMITPIEDFAIEKGSETFANTALHAYKKYGEGAPVISIENLYQGMGFSQGEDLKKLVEKSQERFVENAIKEGYSKSEAEKAAKKLIGVTFDVGHLNISRSHGFKEKDLIKEIEAIKKHVKHVHITDNFGNSDTHLPIGMGNVPVQAMLEALGDEGERARKINEVGGWYQYFKSDPFREILGAVGSQIYSTGEGPYWSQAGGFQQSYMEGYGMMLPDTHYQTFGAGFSQLPSNLGGSRGQSGQGRMGGGGY
jgi:hypothetical protein